MDRLSVVIITCNEEHNIAGCIESAKLVSDDIIVVDSESQDQTVHLAQEFNARVFSIRWKGYGFSRNFGANQAKHNWILALDADERITKELAKAIDKLQLDELNVIYRFRRRNFLRQQKIRFGSLGFETVKRIYNRNYAKWDLTLVHEKLASTRPVKKRIAGYIDHYGIKSKEDYLAKAILYAQMSAEKYFLQGKKSNALKRYFSPLFNSVKSYFFQLGFLDGSKGWITAKIIAYYSWMKYFYLRQLLKESKIRKMNFPSKSQVERA